MTDNTERRLTTVEATLAETRIMLDSIAEQHREVIETQRDLAVEVWGEPRRGVKGLKAETSELRDFFTQLQLSLRAAKWIVAFLGVGYVVVLIRWLLEQNPLIP